MIDTSEITPRLKTLLGILDIETLGQLASNNRIDFLKYRNVGKKTLSEIEDLLYNNGLDFVG
jgi:DNA-directed RNA polymerase alpha subunit